jgi:hypothetical protein
VPVAAVKPRSPASGLPTSPAQVAGPKPRPAAPAPSTPAPPRGPTAAAAVPSRGRGGGSSHPGNRKDGARWLEARRRYGAGEGLAEILMSWDGKKPTRRTLENWTDDLREQHRQARAAKGGGGHGDVAVH